MKRLALALLACGAIAAQDLELTDAARQISAEFRNKNPALDFRSTLAVAKFKTASERLQKNATADLVKAAFEKEFVRSVYFEVVERENLDKVIAEIELRQKGLAQAKAADDVLKGAEYLLVGDLTEEANALVVSARLVHANSGTVVATAQSREPLDASERAAAEFRYNAFQSQYGITLGVDGSLVQPRGETTSSPALVSAFLAYRLARPLRIGAGISYLKWNEFIREEAPIGVSKTYRNYSLNGIGPRVFADFLLSPHPRWLVGVRADLLLMPGMRLEQDVSDMKVWSFDATTGNPTQIGQRVLVNGYSNEGMTIFKPALLVEFLVSKRLSFFLSGGYMLSTVFKPTVYESGGYRQWTESADFNGTFSQYQNYNFNRRPNGNPVEMQMGFVFFDVGLSLHF